MSESRDSRKDKLNSLRLARRKKNKNTQYDEDIYQEVTDDDYNLINDDKAFVEDDDNAGYIDDGYEEQQYSDEYDMPVIEKEKKRKRKVVKEPVAVKPAQQINTFFNNAAIVNANTSTAAKKENADDFFSDLLSGFGTSTTTVNRRMKAPLKNIAVSDTRKVTRRLDGLEDMSKEDTVTGFNADSMVAQPMNDFDYGNDIDFDMDMDDFNMDDFDKDEPVVKKEVEELTMEDLEKLSVKKEPTVKIEQRVSNFPAIDKSMTKPGLNNWESTDMGLADTFAQSITKQENSNIDILQSDGTLDMWWYDAYERLDKGYVYLFGKVLNKVTNEYISCCVIVKNIERNLFVLPRPYYLDDSGEPTEIEVAMEDVYSEFSDLCSKKRITKWLSKEVKRNYAFELKDVPFEANYLKVLYGYDQPVLEADISGKTFSHIFGTRTGPLEHFLLKRDIMGPCWLKVANAAISNTSETWSKTELIVEDPKSVHVLVNKNGIKPTHVPPLVVMSLSLRTILNTKRNANEIIAVSAFICDKVQFNDTKPIEQQSKKRFTVIRQLEKTPYPTGFNDLISQEKKSAGFVVQLERTEASILNFLIAKIHLIDPDVIVGHNFEGFDLDVLLQRMKALNTQHWHRLGRLKRRQWPNLHSGKQSDKRMIMAGRLVCDTYVVSKDLIRSKSYRLGDLAQSQLKIVREDIEMEDTPNYFKSADMLLHYLKHCSFDAYLATSLMFKLQALPLTYQLTTLAGNLWSRTMTGARAERNEFLLLHEFHRRKYISPDKFLAFKAPVVVDPTNNDSDDEAAAPKKKGGKRKPAYAGGLVLEPKKGFYDKYVMLLDFNSLYPSIIQEYNICFTTVERRQIEEVSEDGEDKMPELPNENALPGILPQLLKNLVDNRRKVKALMKNPSDTESRKRQLDIQQQALKLTANSMYGCLGFPQSRFYAKPLAMLITYKGREILQSTVNLATNLGMNVIYGDTDSIMIYTDQSDLNEVKNMANLLKRNVNNLYKLLEIDIDGYFKHMLLLKKKKYAALLVKEKPNGELEEKIETKGLDLVRRDWCDISHDVSSFVLDVILSDKDREQVVDEIHTYLRETGEKIRSGEIPLEKYVINKQLSKRPEEYTDAKSQPHVQVAKRMIEAGHSVKAGDTVPFVICKANEEEKAGANLSYAARAYHPDVIVRDNMSVDIEWYLTQQIYPPITRLCSPIDGTDMNLLAECLGLDSRRQNFNTRQPENVEFLTLNSQISNAERFKAADRLNIICNHCEEENAYDGIVVTDEDGNVRNGLQCTHCDHMMDATSIQVQLTMAIRKYIDIYYNGWFICDDPTCSNRTRDISVAGRRCLSNVCRGIMSREYSNKELHTQLLYFNSIFDFNNAKEKALNSVPATSIVNKHYDLLQSAKEIVDQYLARSGFCYVSLGSLFPVFE
ncbi:DNA polymerase family B-domain-containing protein [Pilobolus umbonatus]|nr:DNA polymerase family B-domain-containing protein [Pilobolus umbonatus]